MENKLLYRILRMISMLGKEKGYTVGQMAEIFEISNKTIYRCLDLLKDAGFLVERDKSNRYYIKKYNATVFSDNLLSFSIDEAKLIKDALLATHSEHPLKNSTLHKLFLLSELDDIVEIFYDLQTAENIRLISQAIKEKRQITLHQYHSSNSNSVTDRLVEPIAFHHNMKYVFAFDVQTKKVRQFKPERSERVSILNSFFKYQQKHNLPSPDVFGMDSTPVFNVCLKLNNRAVNLLKEEFPVSHKHIEPTEKSNVFLFNAKCKGYEGVGRFVLGLPGDIQVLEDKGFIKYLSEKTKNYKIKYIYQLDKI